MWVTTKVFVFVLTILTAGAAMAQQNVWVQIEAYRNLNEAQDRARAYSGQLQQVKGYSLRSGWYAIALGPFAATEADDILRQLRITRQIPGDSYIVDGRSFSNQFWPDGTLIPTAQPLQPIAEDDDGAPLPAAEPLIAAEETPAQARQNERLLTRAERELLQTALKWDGFYNAAIDGAFGPGTRNAMADWQQSRNYEPTGILSTRQRAELVGAYQEMLASLGFQEVNEDLAGIKIVLPMALLEFDRYEPPFVHYRSRDDSGVRALLISQSGDLATLSGLYDIMQTLEIVPLEGPRSKTRTAFTLEGTNAQIQSYTFATASNEMVKGFSLIWPAGADKRRALVLDTMRKSFSMQRDVALPDIYGDPNAAQSRDLLAGLTIRQPTLTRSGFYVSGDGQVLTSADAVQSCEQITLDDSIEAEVAAVDAKTGLALLRPKVPLQPAAFARFLTALPRLNSEVAVSGYSFDGILGAPTLTFGSLEDLQGLAGEPTLKRLAMQVTESDAGGPVFDGRGAVLGMLLPAAAMQNRRLPEGVQFAADTAAIAEFMSAAGQAALASEATENIAPEDLMLVATDMTVLVNCWN